MFSTLCSKAWFDSVSCCNSDNTGSDKAVDDEIAVEEGRVVAGVVSLLLATLLTVCCVYDSSRSALMTFLTFLVEILALAEAVTFFLSLAIGFFLCSRHL